MNNSSHAGCCDECKEIISGHVKRIRLLEERLTKLEQYVAGESRFKDEEEKRMKKYLKIWRSRLPQLEQVWRAQDSELKVR